MSAEVEQQLESAEAGGKPVQQNSRVRSRRGIERWALLIAFVILVAVFASILPGTFASYANLRVILNGQAVIAVAALALLVPLVGGRFDVSVGSNIALNAIVCAAAMSHFSLPLWLAALLALLVGGLVGAINGFFIAYLGVNSLIATLASATIIIGLNQWYTGGRPIATGIDQSLTSVSVGQIAGIPLLAVIMIVLAVIVWYLLTQTVYGRQLTAVGVGLEASRLVGVPVRGRILMSFVISGVLAGFAGILQLGRQGSGDPAAGGIEFILPALAAVFLGATAFTPGRYNVPGTILGLFFVGVAVSGLALLGAKPWVQPVFNGAIVLVAVAASQYANRRRTGNAPIGS
ncbi:MAG: ABC transporter permease [Candidatus Leucobacter sulfamidivorax]|nr:ABC transporter permease [Candidatus Leucobacter sulfamidivorax]